MKQQKLIHKLIFGLILALVLVLPNFTGFAQDQTEEREVLEKELQELEKLIAQYDADITKTEQEKKTLKNQIYILRNKISKLGLQIKESNIMIKDLGFQINDTENSIEKTSFKIDDSKEKLADILRVIYEEDQKSLLEILLSEQEFSGFFNNLVALEILNDKNQELLENIKALKIYLESQKQSLDGEKGDLEKIVKIQLLQKQESQSTKKNQEYHLKITEIEYQKSLKDKKETEKKASEIRARIFELVGTPEKLSFGEALEIAKYVKSVTGIRPAFLLAIITQESALGRNVGQCYLKNSSTGQGIVVYNGKTINRVMSPKRDVKPFLTITKELNRDPYNTLVSCPMSYGWGGAMGPSQFIPSTWILYRDKVKSITGKPADPWNIKNAFLASGFLLKDNGGIKNERKAALRYFAGGNWNNPKYAFYGNQVVKRINCLQVFIDNGTMTKDCESRVFIPK